MESDIVARLRLRGGLDERLNREAADEIERLRRDYSSICSEMRRMMEERDEARREVCRIDAETYGSVVLVAERRGWDCYRSEVSNER